ncbi:MAG: S9 family peptidase [Acidimicrobiales bacterium]
MNYDLNALFRSAAPAPAVPKRIPYTLEGIGGTRIDEFYWMRDETDPDVKAYLLAENDFYQRVTSPLAPLKDRIFEEIRSKVKETDLSIPVPKGPYEYYGRTVEGLQYPIHCRRPRGGTEEEILLDENVIAGTSEYLAFGTSSVSPDHRQLAYSVDFDGSESFELRVGRIGDDLESYTLIPNTYYGLVWSEDSSCVLYTRADESMRPFQVWRHVLGTESDSDVLVFQEDDERFFVDVSKTSDDRFLVIDVQSKTTTEQWTIPALSPFDPPTLFVGRETGIEYSLDHHDLGYFVVTNFGRTDFRLVSFPDDARGANKSEWSDFITFAEDERLEGIELFRSHLVILLRREGLLELRLQRLADGVTKVIEQPDALATIWPSANAEFDTDVFRYEYTSFTRPHGVYELSLADYSTRLLKEQEVVGGYQPADYVANRIWADGVDGTRIPVSIVHRADLDLAVPRPTLLYGYGSYEHAIDPSFSVARLSLLDRGFIYAVAHVRGGGELGRNWYENGKLGYKVNTFTDFISAARLLIERSLTTPELLAARGGSAGGLLMGAIATMAPEVFRLIIAEVPFVDCLTTISDPELPLTVTEWEEWGNPLEDREIYDLMASYSPYDNLRASVTYPAFYLTAGLNDPRVSYWEPAKFAAKLRQLSPATQLVLHTELGAGHMGPSGRYDAWRDEANVLAFLVTALSGPIDPTTA